MKTLNRPPPTQAGMTLIEVLVSLLIFSFGLLGFVGLQARAIQYSTSAENSNRAALLANEMATTIQLSQPAAPAPFAMPTADVITAWQTRVTTAAVAGLPNASGTVTPSGPNAATITIKWQQPGTVASQDQYVTQVVVPQ